MAVDKAALLARRLPERDVEIPDVGTVRVRGLSRGEVLRLSELDGNIDAGEMFVLTNALVDPSLTEEEARTWRDISPAGELAVVFDTVAELSGLREKALGDAVRTFRDDGSSV